MDIEVSGARILYQNDWFCLTETVVVMWIVMAVIVAACLFLTWGMKVHATSKRQIVAEYLVKTVNNLVKGYMGDAFCTYAPLVAALLSLSALCSLSSLVGSYSPTSDLSAPLGWAVLVFILITYYKIKAKGVGGYFKGFFEPLPPLAPINVIGEIATPVSMAFRHYGNVASGSIITALMYAALSAASAALFGIIPGAVGQFLSYVPILQVGLPAILSIYFDLFSSCLQAFIFCMLMMINIRTAAEG